MLIYFQKWKKIMQLHSSFGGKQKKVSKNVAFAIQPERHNREAAKILINKNKSLLKAVLRAWSHYTQ